ncbi:unnamed protein product [Pedinophyceae sp. YPF-701]|nr:unnamed protein product [Pedinophyceae sp. YPF-701]
MVDFGFQMVSEGLKSSLVRDVFKSVAPSYDVMNDLMSGGLHRLWKDQVVDMLGPFRGMSHLDVAGGTGDIASRVVRAINAYPEGLQAERAAGGRSRVVVSDINEDMLEVGRKREWAQQTGCVDVEWAVADAENLPFPDNEFDAYTVAFGIRNVTRRDKALREAHRVLKRGGRFLCLEFSHVEDEFLSKAYDAYSFHVIPAIGQAVAGDAKSYEYLVESIRQFPNAEDFAREVRGAGFRAVSHETLTMGVVAIHSGFKL